MTVQTPAERRGLRYLSVCSGIEAATQAWHPLGWSPVAFSEIEKFPSEVLAHHYPAVPNWGDMTKFQEWPDADVDVLAGGTPCQSFSVAGLRKGLADPRGNLMLTYLAIAAKYRPRWLVWENVPGVLSSNGGRDFAAFLGGLGQLGYGFAYRVLDAQHVRTRRFPFAVPQRRRRVWVVGYLGDWRRAAAVLFDRESLSGHPAPRREAGQVAPTIPARSLGGGGLGTDFDCDGGLIPVAIQERAICENPDAGPDGAGIRQDGASYTLEARTVPQAVAHPITLMQRGREDGPSIEWRQDGTANALLTPNGGRAGMGVGCVAIPAAFDLKQITSATNRSIPQPVSPTMAKASNLHAFTPWQVRRLTPVEAERLQGFPDNFTAIPWRGKPADQCPDGPRYKALGNSWAVNCAEYIGERIAMVDALNLETAA